MRKLFPFFLIAFALACQDTNPLEPTANDVDSPDVTAAFSKKGVVSSVVGNGHFTVFDAAVNSFMFNAHEKADGTVMGEATMHIRLNGTFWKLDIDCLAVSGNVAVVSGVVSHSNTPYVGTGGWVAMEDNGEGGNAGPDRVTGFYGTPPPYLPVPGYCHEVIQDIDAYLEPFAVKWNEVVRGNLQVKGG
jgi:hypothetical protein